MDPQWCFVQHHVFLVHMQPKEGVLVGVEVYSCVGVLVPVLGRIFHHSASPGVVGMDFGRTRTTSLTGKMV